MRTLAAIRGIGLASILALLPATAPAMEGTLAVQFIGMTPRGKDADLYGENGFGVGFRLIAPFSRTMGHAAGVVGLEFVGMKNQGTIYFDPVTMTNYETQTNQYFGRVSLGLEIGSHGRGLLRPHVGADAALDFYGISTDFVTADRPSGGASTQQRSEGEQHAAFGYAAGAGLDVNPWNTVSFDVGARWVQSFNVPPLDYGVGKVHTQYLQIYLGVGLALPWLGGHVDN
jgi:opacity protein-like surface antigen